MIFESSSNKAKKWTNSLESALQSLSLNKAINPRKRYEMQLNERKLNLVKMKRIEAEILDFHNKIEKDDDLTMKRLTVILKAAKRPKKLDLTCRDCKGLSDRGLGYISEGIKRLASLKDIKLEFSECESMTDEGMKVIAKAMKNLTSLQQLTLKFQTSQAATAFSDRGLKYLSRALQKPVSLKSLHLDLSAMTVTDVGMKYLSQSLKALGSLKTLHIHLRKHSQVTDQGIKIFQQSLKTLKGLEDIDLDFKNVSEEGFLSLSECFTKYTSIKHLGLCFEHSNITDEGMELFGQHLKRINPLQSIHFGFPGCQRITDIGVIYLHEGLEKHTSLTSINLNFMDCPNITNTSTETIVDIFKNPLSLKHLILNFCRNNEINHKGIRCLYQGIEELASSLQSLHLGFLNMKINYQDFDDDENENEDEDEDCEGSEDNKYFNAGESLGHVLTKLTVLKSISLNVSGCNDVYMCNIMGYLQEPLTSLKSLQSVSFDFSNIEMLLDNEEGDFVEFLEQLTSIQNLSVSFENYYEYIEEIADCLTKFTSLQSIAVDFSSPDGIFEESQTKLRQVLDRLPQLKRCSVKC